MIFAFQLFAHKLNVFCNEDNETIYIKGYYTKSSPCIECEYKVIQYNQLLHRGKLDKNGTASFKQKITKPITVEVQAEAGHRGETLYTPYSPPEKSSSIHPAILQNLNLLLSLALIYGFFEIFRRIKSR